MTLTGFGTHTFGAAVDNMLNAYMCFANSLPEGKLEHWQLASTEPHVTIDSSTRYFTEKKYAKNTTNLQFGFMIDPAGSLAGMQNSELVHGFYNYVEYVEMAEHDGAVR